MLTFLVPNAEGKAGHCFLSFSDGVAVVIARSIRLLLTVQIHNFSSSVANSGCHQEHEHNIPKVSLHRCKPQSLCFGKITLDVDLQTPNTEIQEAQTCYGRVRHILITKGFVFESWWNASSGSTRLMPSSVRLRPNRYITLWTIYTHTPILSQTQGNEYQNVGDEVRPQINSQQWHNV